MSIEADIRPTGPSGPTGPIEPLPHILVSVEGGGPSTVSLANGGQALIRLDVVRVETSTAVQLAALGLPPGVQARFSPGSLPAGTGAAIVTLELVAATSAAAAHAAVGVWATGADATPGVLAVSLTVVSPFSQIAGAPTLPIGTSGASTVTSASTVVLGLIGEARTAVNLELAAGVQGSISFAIAGGLPPGISAQFQPATVTAPGEAGTIGVEVVMSAGPTVVPSTGEVTVEVSVGGTLRGSLRFPLQVVALGSNTNQFLASACNPLIGVAVTISVTEDLIAAPPDLNQQPGFAFQLNASSPKNAGNPADAEWIVWQQYIIGVGRGEIGGAINNWTAASLSGEQTINSPVVVVATPPQPNMVPAGYSLTILLQTDAAGNVTAVTFDSDPGASHTLVLTSLTKTGGGQVGSADLAPIVAFELNLVGPGDLKHANFSSGAGTITYAAATPLQPLLSLPPCVANGATTGETSNSLYSALSSGPSNTLIQSFSFKPVPKVGVPKLVGLAPEAVFAALAKVGLVGLEQIGATGSPLPRQPVCTSQGTPPGTQVPEGSTVTFWIEEFVTGKTDPVK